MIRPVESKYCELIGAYLSILMWTVRLECIYNQKKMREAGKNENCLLWGFEYLWLGSGLFLRKQYQ